MRPRPESALVPASRRHDVAVEAGRLRREAERRYSEADLLVAALREHIDDLRSERDRLLAENDALRAQLEHSEASSMWGRFKPPR